MRKLLVLLVLVITLFGCTQNQMVKVLGGKTRIDIPSDRQFVNMTWKDNEMWVLTKMRSKSDTIKSIYFFKEKSSFGINEGEVTIVEN
jgi:hypothetical protein